MKKNMVAVLLLVATSYPALCARKPQEETMQDRPAPQKTVQKESTVATPTKKASNLDKHKSNLDKRFFEIQDALMNGIEIETLRAKLEALRTKGDAIKPLGIDWKQQLPALLAAAQTGLRIVDIRLENSIRTNKTDLADVSTEHMTANANLNLVREFIKE